MRKARFVILFGWASLLVIEAQRPIVSPHVVGYPSVNTTLDNNGFPNVWYEDWSGAAACGAMTGNCRHPWKYYNGTGVASLVTAASAGFSGKWVDAGTNALQMAIPASTTANILTYLPFYYLGNTSPYSSWTWHTRIYLLLKSSGIGNFGQVQLMGWGNATLTDMAILDLHRAGSASAYDLEMAGGGGSYPIGSLPMSAPVVIDLIFQAGTNASHAYANGNTTPFATFTINSADPVYSMSIGNGASASAVSFAVGMLGLSSPDASAQLNPPDVFIDGAGATSGNALSVSDFSANGAAHGGGCNGGWGSEGSLSNMVWDNSQTINSLIPITSGGKQYLGNVGISIMMNAAADGTVLECNVAGNTYRGTLVWYFKGSFTAGAPGALATARIDANGDWTAVNFGLDSKGNTFVNDHSYCNGVTGTGSNVILSPATNWYIGVLNYVSQGAHWMDIYTANGTYYGTSTTPCTTKAAAPITEFDIGRVGSGTQTGYVWWSNIIWDWTQGRPGGSYF